MTWSTRKLYNLYSAFFSFFSFFFFSLGCRKERQESFACVVVKGRRVFSHPKTTQHKSTNPPFVFPLNLNESHEHSFKWFPLYFFSNPIAFNTKHQSPFHSSSLSEHFVPINNMTFAPFQHNPIHHHHHHLIHLLELFVHWSVTLTTNNPTSQPHPQTLLFT